MRPLPRALTTIAAAAAVLALSGCVSSAPQGGSPTGSDPDTVILGAAVAETGFMSVADVPALSALRLAVDDLNAAGGIDGKTVELKVLDTGSVLDKYAPTTQQLIDAGAKAIILTCDYDLSSPGALVAQQAGILSLSPCVGDTLWGPKAGLDISFSFGNATPGEGAVMAEFSYDKGWHNAVFLTDTSIKYTQSQCRIAKERFTELGGTSVGDYDYIQGDSVREIVSKISAGPKPDIIFNCGYNPGGGQVAKDLRDGGLSTPVISGFGMDGTFWLGSTPGLSDYYVVAYGSTTGDDPNPEINDLADRVQKSTGQRPTTSGFVTGPSTLQALVKAHDIAQSWDGQALTDALQSFDDVDLLVGPTTFTEKVHVGIDRPQAIMVVSDGTLTFVERRAPQKVDIDG